MFSLASFSQCEECQGWGLGAVGRRDEEVGSGVGCGGTGWMMWILRRKGGVVLQED